MRGPLQMETMMQGDEHQGDRWFKEAMQQAKMAETIQAMKAETRAQGTPLGETGRFIHGALTPDDEGELRHAVTASGGKRILAFGTPVEGIGMTPRMAHQRADAVNKWASETRSLTLCHACVLRREPLGPGGTRTGTPNKVRYTPRGNPWPTR